MSWDVSGKVGVITGASCSLGREIVNRLALRHHMKLACVSRNPFATPLPVNCNAFRADITQSNDCNNLFKSIQEQLGDVSVVVNCAGITLNKLFLLNTDRDYDLVIKTNLIGSLNVTRAALRYGGLLKMQDCSVLFVGSVVGVTGNEGQVLYSATKAALLGAAKSLGKEYGSKNIRFNVVAPGLLEGEGMSRTLTEAQCEAWRRASPLGRLATASEVSDVVVSTILSPYITGQTIIVDGGISL
ncbi:unnamed protein product [Phytomonas sp. EM1]|nr:unnamed protein product [Phytomonas sp. EM1]|eukprot:CCW63600.1 unnamed protein product [Phytomonas sp. isolate EM1]